MRSARVSGGSRLLHHTPLPIPRSVPIDRDSSPTLPTLCFPIDPLFPPPPTSPPGVVAAPPCCRRRRSAARSSTFCGTRRSTRPCRRTRLIGTGAGTWSRALEGGALSRKAARWTRPPTRLSGRIRLYYARGASRRGRRGRAVRAPPRRALRSAPRAAAGDAAAVASGREWRRGSDNRSRAARESEGRENHRAVDRGETRMRAWVVSPHPQGLHIGDMGTHLNLS
mmetsp:Transcript_28132/g.83027  ORF Transcript_28132/g.83027 Transcript_28132/m.83027 type:complete len:225 (-) Transcript_28132:70-744(-)